MNPYSSPEFEGLSRRIVNVLLVEGIASKEAVRKLGYFGLLKIPNIGKKAAKELCVWADVEPPEGQRRQLEALDAAILSLGEVRASRKPDSAVFVALSCSLNALRLARASIAGIGGFQ